MESCRTRPATRGARQRRRRRSRPSPADTGAASSPSCALSQGAEGPGFGAGRERRSGVSTTTRAGQQQSSVLPSAIGSGAARRRSGPSPVEARRTARPGPRPVGACSFQMGKEQEATRPALQRGARAASTKRPVLRRAGRRPPALAEEFATRPEPLTEATRRPQSRRIGRELGGIEALLRAGGAAAVDVVQSCGRKLGRASVQMKVASRRQALSLGRSTPGSRPYRGISVKPLGSMW